MEVIKGFAKKHGIYVLILVLVILFNLQNFISFDKLPTIDHSSTYLARNYILKNSFTKYNDLMPLWNPYLMGGTPYFDYAGSPTIFSITGWLAFLFPPILATNLNYVLDIILAAMMMYILVYYLTKNSKAGLIGGMVYGLAGPMIRLFHHGALTQMNGIILTPLLYLFMVHSFKKEKIKSFINYSIILGILFALQARFNPDLKIVLFTSLMFGLFLIFQLITGLMSRLAITRQLIRIGLSGLIVGSIFIGLTAQQILPQKDFLDITSRGHLPYEQSASRKTELKDLFKTIIEPLYKEAFKIRPIARDVTRSSKFEGVFKIGIIAALLIICGWVLQFKNKHPIKHLISLIKGMFKVGIITTLKIIYKWICKFMDNPTIFLTIVAVFALSITTGSFVFYLLWKYVPPFDSFRYLERVYSLFLFAAAALTGLGANALLEKIKERWKTISFGAIAGLIFLNLAIFNIEPTATYAQADVKDLIEANEILKYVSEDKDTFRMHPIETKGIDWTTDFLQIPYRLEGLYGEEGTWLVEYMNTYLKIGWKDPAKFWGMLNVKYVTSTKPIKVDGLKLIKKFKNCTICPPIKEHYRAFGPYLYFNELDMPRAYIVQNAILIIGKKNKGMEAIYLLLLHKEFNPATTVLIYGKENVTDYAREELEKYNKIILQKKINPKELELLKLYTKSGGEVLPNIFKKRLRIEEDELREFLTTEKRSKIVQYRQIDFDHKEFKTNNQMGWLVISEKFSSFPGWHTVGIDKEIHKANGIVSAIWLDGTEDKILFEYKPKSYVIGTWMMVLTIILVIGYFSYYILYKRKASQVSA